MKGLAESSPFHLLTNPHVINRFIFGHGVVIYYVSFLMENMTLLPLVLKKRCSTDSSSILFNYEYKVRCG